MRPKRGDEDFCSCGRLWLGAALACALCGGLGLVLFTLLFYAANDELFELVRAERFGATVLAVPLIEAVGLAPLPWLGRRRASLAVVALQLACAAAEVAVCAPLSWQLAEARASLQRHLRLDVVYEFGAHNRITAALNQMQTKRKCCGASGFDDYLQREEFESKDFHEELYPTRQLIPDSCCVSYQVGCGINRHPNNIYYKGCLESMKHSVKYNLQILIVACCLEAFFHTVLFFLSLALLCKSRRAESQPTSLPLHEANHLAMHYFE